jgi:hypothetical protein
VKDATQPIASTYVEGLELLWIGDRTICAEVGLELTTTPAGQSAACHFAGELAAAG